MTGALKVPLTPTSIPLKCPKGFKSTRDGKCPKEEQYCLLIMKDGKISGELERNQDLDENSLIEKMV